MQHAEKTTAEPKAQRIGGLRLVKQRRVVQCQLAQGIAKIFVIISVHGKDAGVHLGLHALESR